MSPSSSAEHQHTYINIVKESWIDTKTGQIILMTILGLILFMLLLLFMFRR